LSIYFKNTCEIQEQDGLERAAAETDTTHGNIRDRLQLDEGDPGYQLLTEVEDFQDVVRTAAETNTKQGNI
jgi:hypothetical protein